jgi:hypothetical protein
MDFEPVVIAAMSPERGVRQQAEAVVVRTRDVTPDVYLCSLATLLRESANSAVRQFAAVMLRQALAGEVKALAAAAPATVQLVQQTLMHLFRVEDSRSIRRKVCDVVGVLAAKLLGDGAWPSLLPLVFEMYQAPTAAPMHKESCLDVVAAVAEYVVAALQPHAATLLPMLQGGLQDAASSDVRLAAMRATVSLLLSLDRSERRNLATVVPVMFASLQAAYATKDDGDVRETLELLAEFAKEVRVVSLLFVVVSYFVSLARK